MLRVFIPLAIVGSIAGNCAFAADDRKDAPKDFDHKFLSKVPHHHQGAVEMANLCEQKAQHADLRAFCSKLATEQDREKSQMESWRSSWYGQEAQVPEMPSMQAQHKQRITKLEGASGEQFDHAFLMSMTEHHQEGMPDMKSCVASAKRSELRQLCRQMSEQQQKEVAQMHAWMKEWGGGGMSHHQ
ncbi:MAG TPA: DUF305 domain-containing protein [Terriglobales bacterium]|nr:DUF305 domain-containing protein [Terriglobales bacterium]